MGDRRKRIPALLRKIGLKRRLFIGFVIVSLLPVSYTHLGTDSQRGAEGRDNAAVLGDELW